MFINDHLVAAPRPIGPGELTIDDLIWLVLGGELEPWAELSGPAGTTSVWDEILRWNELTPNGWLANRCEQAAATALWSLIEPGGPLRWICGTYTLDQLRQLSETGYANEATDVILQAPGAKSIPLGWLLALPLPVAPKPKEEIPWGKIALAVGGGILSGLALAWVIKKAGQDPEPEAIKRIAKRFGAEGAEVYADVRGYPKPPLMNGRIADVVAYHDDGFVEVVEVENDRSIYRSHAAAQIEDLAAWASRSSSRSFSVEVVEGGRGGKG